MIRIALTLSLLALGSSAQAQSAPSWEGVWSGVWPSGTSTSVTISGGRPQRYVIDGKDQPISGSTTASAKYVVFSNDGEPKYQVLLTRQSANAVAADFTGEGRRPTRTTLRRK
jgi:hypothetical protein